MRTLTALSAIALLGIAAAAPAAEYLPVAGGSFRSVLPQDVPERATAPVPVAPYTLRATPVTVGEYADFVRAHPEWRRGQAPEVLAGPGYLAGWRDALEPGLPEATPVTEVSWFAASAFCESEGARLPSWLEWEFAAAADANRTDARDDPQWQRTILGWYERPAQAALPAVGGVPNAWGVRDLHGLVWEWVDDFNALFIAGDSRTQGDPDRLKFCGAGAISIVRRDSYAVLMRVAMLSSLNAADTTRTLGFRCARPLPKEPSR